MHLSTFGEDPGEISPNTNDHTGAEHIDHDNNHHTYRDPDRGANRVIPISDDDRSGTTG